MMSWLPSFFIEEAGFGAGLAAVTTAGIVALNAVGCPIGGWLLRFASRSALLGVTAATVGMLAVLVFDSGVGDDLKIAQAALGSLVGPPAVAAVVAWTGGWGNARWFLFAMAAVGVLLALALSGIEHRLAAHRRQIENAK